MRWHISVIPSDELIKLKTPKAIEKYVSLYLDLVFGSFVAHPVSDRYRQQGAQPSAFEFIELLMEMYYEIGLLIPYREPCTEIDEKARDNGHRSLQYLEPELQVAWLAYRIVHVAPLSPIRLYTKIGNQLNGALESTFMRRAIRIDAGPSYIHCHRISKTTVTARAL
jgi:hypothetical protein